MTTFQARVHIEASPEHVWTILTDTDDWPQWVPGVSKVDGEIAPDATVTVRSTAGRQIPFPVTITEMDKPSLLRMDGSAALGAFKATRTYQLTADADGTHFLISESHTGPIAWMVKRTNKDLPRWFEQFTCALKQRAELTERSE